MSRRCGGIGVIVLASGPPVASSDLGPGLLTVWSEDHTVKKKKKILLK